MASFPSLSDLFSRTYPFPPDCYRQYGNSRYRICGDLRTTDYLSEKHPFQESGEKARFASEKLNPGMFTIWLEMPGVGKNELNVWTDEDAVFFDCKAPKESEHEEERHYKGMFDVTPGCLLNMKQVRAEVEDGLVTIFMPTSY